MSSDGIYVYSPPGLVSASVTASLKVSSLQPSYWRFLFPVKVSSCLSQAQHVSHTTPLSLGGVSEAQCGACCRSPGVPRGLQGGAVLRWMRWLPEVSLPGENWLHAPYLFLRSAALPGSWCLLAVQCPPSAARTPAWFCCKACWHPHVPPARRRSRQGPRCTHPCLLRWCFVAQRIVRAQ